MDSLNLVDFLDIPIVMVRSGTQRSNSFIHHGHGSDTCFSHGMQEQGSDTKC